MHLRILPARVTRMARIAQIDLYRRRAIITRWAWRRIRAADVAEEASPARQAITDIASRVRDTVI